MTEFLSCKTIALDEPPPAIGAAVQWHWSARSAAASAALPEAAPLPVPQAPALPSSSMPRVPHIDGDDGAVPPGA